MPDKAKTALEESIKKMGKIWGKKTGGKEQGTKKN
jgi:hypothetical protein